MINEPALTGLKQVILIMEASQRTVCFAILHKEKRKQGQQRYQTASILHHQTACTDSQGKQGVSGRESRCANQESLVVFVKLLLRAGSLLQRLGLTTILQTSSVSKCEHAKSTRLCFVKVCEVPCRAC